MTASPADRLDAVERTVVALDGTCMLGRALIGGKAWSINRMRALGLRVPPAFATTTQTCADYHRAGRCISVDLWEEIVAGVAEIGRGTDREFGGRVDADGRLWRPLLLSVRSGGAVSMPGMMDTVLDLGMNHDVEAALATETGDPAYAADTHRRFVELYRSVVLDGDESAPVPSDPWEQLSATVSAVFDSWHSERAGAYRNHHGIAHDGGTAVTIQAMVFGNLDDRSGTGVMFSRNPMTGEAPAWGEWLTRGQGEDVVSGRLTPQPLDALSTLLPDVHAEILDNARRLEEDGRDLQDIEFTVESGTLWMLQARPAKRAARAAVRAAVDLAREGVLSPEEALDRVTPDQVRALLRPTLIEGDADAAEGPAARGEAASPGWASGVVVTDPDEAEERAEAGESVILARTTTSPDDFPGMLVSAAVVTELGGSTSHAAVVGREIGVPCVVGCGADTVTTLAGRTVTVDGTRGTVWLGTRSSSVVDEASDPDLAQLWSWLRERLGARVLRHGEPLPDDVDAAQVVSLDGASETIPETVSAALRQGRVVVADNVVPILLTAWHADR
jgi:pyruvate,orthophosphate dikinase